MLSLTFYPLSSTCLINSIKHKHSCKIFYVCKYFQDDPTLTQYRAELITDAGRKLDKARMIRFDERTGYFACTDQGRIASHFYIKYDTVEVSIELTGRKLDKARMIRFDERTGYFACTDQGRIASHFYIKYDTVGVSIELESLTRLV